MAEATGSAVAMVGKMVAYSKARVVMWTGGGLKAPLAEGAWLREAEKAPTGRGAATTVVVVMATLTAMVGIVLEVP